MFLLLNLGGARKETHILEILRLDVFHVNYFTTKYFYIYIINFVHILIPQRTKIELSRHLIPTFIGTLCCCAIAICRIIALCKGVLFEKAFFRNKIPLKCSHK